MEEANLPDVLEHWTLCEYVELAVLRAAKGSIRHQNLHSVLLWMDGQELMEAFDVAFGPVKEYDLDVLHTLTLTGKVFQVFSLQEWKSQLRLIDGCYNGHINLASELLMVGTPDEISPLFTFRTVGIAHHPRVSSWPSRAFLEAPVLSGLVAGRQEDNNIECQTLLRRREHDCVLKVHHSVTLFRPPQVQSLDPF